uniref:Prolyl 4-hydroxylase alpha-subunit N-terminal domain-containing protein n=1 Tax=Clastoptera arizonana TaxID=38151 RepID=A0A1B6CRL7_9HEMI
MVNISLLLFTTFLLYAEASISALYQMDLPFVNESDSSEVNQTKMDLAYFYKINDLNYESERVQDKNYPSILRADPTKKNTTRLLELMEILEANRKVVKIIKDLWDVNRIRLRNKHYRVAENILAGIQKFHTDVGKNTTLRAKVKLILRLLPMINSFKHDVYAEGILANHTDTVLRVYKTEDIFGMDIV